MPFLLTVRQRLWLRYIFNVNVEFNAILTFILHNRHSVKL